jgi:hypothetical protein
MIYLALLLLIGGNVLLGMLTSDELKLSPVMIPSIIISIILYLAVVIRFGFLESKRHIMTTVVKDKVYSFRRIAEKMYYGKDDDGGSSSMDLASCLKYVKNTLKKCIESEYLVGFSYSEEFKRLMPDTQTDLAETPGC